MGGACFRDKEVHEVRDAPVGGPVFSSPQITTANTPRQHVSVGARTPQGQILSPSTAPRSGVSLSVLSSGSSSAATDPAAAEKIRVCAVSEFNTKSRVVSTRFREVAIWKVDEKFYALDNACYHHGAPLANGDIEDMDGRSCIVCPWHGYRITLAEGEGLYVGLGPDMKKSCVKTKGVKQRPHSISIENDDIFLNVHSEGRIESDGYAGQVAPIGAGGQMHSAAPGKTFGSSLNDSNPKSTDNETGAPLDDLAHSSSSKYEPKEIVQNGPIALLLVDKRAACESNEAYYFKFEIVIDGAFFEQASTVFGYPGQHAVLSIHLPEDVVVERTLTITRRPTPTAFEVLSRRKEGGLVSNWLIDSVEVGASAITLQHFGGSFGVCMHPPETLPRVILVSGGVGITPTLGAMQTMFASFGKRVPARMAQKEKDLANCRVTIIHVDRTQRDIPGLVQIESVLRDRVSVDIFLTREEGAVAAESPFLRYHTGRPSLANVETILSEQDISEPCPVFVCGPESFYTGMCDIFTSLTTPFPAEMIHTEKFD